MKIFISYTLRDGALVQKDFELIVKSLKNHCVFIHFLHSHITNQEIINQELTNSDLVILIRTPFSFKSEWVIHELKLAYSLKKPIFMIDLKDLREQKRII